MSAKTKRFNEKNLVSALISRESIGAKNICHRLATASSFMDNLVSRPQDCFWMGDDSLPYATAFSQHGGVDLAIAGESGSVTLCNSSCNVSNAMKSAKSWVAHDNAIFDVIWTDTHQIVTASGDQTCGIWDVNAISRVSSFIGHFGSVKCVRQRPTDQSTFATCGRDGGVLFWDTRANGKISLSNQSSYISPTLFIQNAHSVSSKPNIKRKVVPSTHTVTSLEFLSDGCGLVSSGASDGRIKLWDLRMIRSRLDPPKSLCNPVLEIEPIKNEKSGGIIHLSISEDGSQLLANSKSGKVFLYNTSHLDSENPIVFMGSPKNSFYVKTTFGFNDNFILSGSNDGRAYIWQTKFPQAQPLRLSGHSHEVTAVSWCKLDPTRLVTSSDDSTVRIWNINPNASVIFNAERNWGYTERYTESIVQDPTTPNSARQERDFHVQTPTSERQERQPISNSSSNSSSISNLKRSRSTTILEYFHRISPSTPSTNTASNSQSQTVNCESTESSHSVQNDVKGEELATSSSASATLNSPICSHSIGKYGSLGQTKRVFAFSTCTEDDDFGSFHDPCRKRKVEKSIAKVKISV